MGKRPSSSTRRWRRPSWHTTPRAQPPLSCLASPSRASGLRRSKEVPHPGVLALRQRGLPEQLRRADRAGEAQAARALFHRFFRGRRLFLLLRRVGQEFKSSVLAKAALRVVGERIRETRDQAVKRVAPQLKMAATRQPRPKLDSSVLFSCSQGKKLSQAPRGRPSRRRVGPRRPGEAAKQSLEPREPLPSGARIVLGARAAGFLADRRESGEPLHWPLGRKKPVLSLAFLGPAPQDPGQTPARRGQWPRLPEAGVQVPRLQQLACEAPGRAGPVAVSVRLRGPKRAPRGQDMLAYIRSSRPGRSPSWTTLWNLHTAPPPQSLSLELGRDLVFSTPRERRSNLLKPQQKTFVGGPKGPETKLPPHRQLRERLPRFF